MFMFRGGNTRRAQSSPRHACGLRARVFRQACAGLHRPPALAHRGRAEVCPGLRFPAAEGVLAGSHTPFRRVEISGVASEAGNQVIGDRLALYI